jgi:acetate kinase
MGKHILCINTGSSSMKFSLYLLKTKEKLIAEGAVERIAMPDGWLWLKDGKGNLLEDRHANYPAHSDAVKAMFTVALEEHHLPAPDAVGHRLVHGGSRHTGPEIVTPKLMKIMQTLIPLAPMHLPSEIKGIEAVHEHYPKLSQVVCFDTSFHSHMPEIAKCLPIERSLWREGLRRYGFHGLSYEYIVSVLGRAMPEKVIIAHLGNGASMTALKNGRPQDTTMGFSALGGLMMGSRCGDIDPGVLLYLIEEKGYKTKQLQELLYQQSGLTGVSGISSDMKTLLDKQTGKPHAAQAIELFCYTARKYIGTLSSVLGGLDTLIFTGGIGERAAPIRRGICQGLEYLGIKLDSRRNKAQSDTISTKDSSCIVRVIPTNEDLMIARHTRALLFN